MVTATRCEVLSPLTMSRLIVVENLHCCIPGNILSFCLPQRVGLAPVCNNAFFSESFFLFRSWYVLREPHFPNFLLLCAILLYHVRACQSREATNVPIRLRQRKQANRERLLLYCSTSSTAQHSAQSAAKQVRADQSQSATTQAGRQELARASTCRRAYRRRAFIQRSSQNERKNRNMPRLQKYLVPGQSAPRICL